MRMSVQPQIGHRLLAHVETLSPVTTARVRAELTIGFPNSDFAA